MFLRCILERSSESNRWIISTVIDIISVQFEDEKNNFRRRLPNTDHSCLGHFQKIIQTIKSFYISTYEVRRVYFLLILFSFQTIVLSKNKSLPSVQWIKTINNTHGSIRVMVDLTNGNKPSNVFVYHSKTLDDKRFESLL